MIILGSAIVALILLIWFRTEAWLEYTRLLRFNFLSKYKDYDAKRKQDVSLDYIKYLRIYHDCFFVRMITCPVCLAVWVGLAFSMFTFPFQFPIVIVGGLLGFTAIDRLLG